MFFEIIKKAILFLCVIYSAVSIYRFFLEKAYKILDAIYNPNFPTTFSIDKGMIAFAIYFLLIVILIAEIYVILWLFSKRKKKEG